MPFEPPNKRAIAFFDGQNLFHTAKLAFGHEYPNYDPLTLAVRICQQEGWDPQEVRFYTGYPTEADNPFWHRFWSKKLAQMGKRGVVVYSRSLRYRKKEFKLAGGASFVTEIPEEKGIDVRIALDIIRLALRNAYDIALVFSQDQDLSEVADEIRDIANEQDRWIKIASAFPDNPNLDAHLRRGINKTDWIRISKSLYDACLDKRDYR